ncbi:efflux RND transporter periplasmic adaptor subunit [Oceanobacter mangrovi]|uniref:efflux RND transporter periplasmic adaptor subunit n=1 Tax=Oceanobacter mangrovi TaxID=2862510 RepID=UPI001C8D710A|nr:HlyD family secretion protein [Oceanobacter mangrovi]
MKNSIRIAITLVVVAAALLTGKWVWDHYLYSPWTRDGRIRADVITIAPDVSGWITQLSAANNQAVKKGDLLFAVDDQRYQAAVIEDKAAVEEARYALELAQHQYQRRQQLTSSKAISSEDLESYRIKTDSAQASLALAQAKLAADQINLTRTRVQAPADGTIINLNLNSGNYVAQGKAVLSMVKAGSFYVTGYFEETKIQRVREGQLATIYLMGYSKPLIGRVRTIGQGIANANTIADGQLLPQIQQTFNWVRLAQRIPVDIELESVPDGVHLSAGMTASIHLQQD